MDPDEPSENTAGRCINLLNPRAVQTELMLVTRECIVFNLAFHSLSLQKPMIMLTLL